MPELFPLTHCRHCGAAVRRIDGTLYRTDAILIHTCTPPPPEPLTFNTTTTTHNEPHA